MEHETGYFGVMLGGRPGEATRVPAPVLPIAAPTAMFGAATGARPDAPPATAAAAIVLPPPVIAAMLPTPASPDPTETLAAIDAALRANAAHVTVNGMFLSPPPDVPVAEPQRRRR